MIYVRGATIFVFLWLLHRWQSDSDLPGFETESTETSCACCSPVHTCVGITSSMNPHCSPSLRRQLASHLPIHIYILQASSTMFLVMVCDVTDLRKERRTCLPRPHLIHALMHYTLLGFRGQRPHTGL